MAAGGRVGWDQDGYLRLARSACFVCELVAGNPEYPHHVAYQDRTVVAFLSRFPLWPAHLLVAPTAHREQVIGDVDVDEYLAVQRVVHAAGRALTELIETERLYVCSLGSQQGNRHVHWHLIPLPPGVRYEEQQAAALRPEQGWLEIPASAQAALTAALATRIAEDLQTAP